MATEATALPAPAAPALPTMSYRQYLENFILGEALMQAARKAATKPPQECTREVWVITKNPRPTLATPFNVGAVPPPDALMIATVAVFYDVALRVPVEARIERIQSREQWEADYQTERIARLQAQTAVKPALAGAK